MLLKAGMVRNIHKASENPNIFRNGHGIVEEMLVTTSAMRSADCVTVHVVIEINNGIAISPHHKSHPAVERLLPLRNVSALERVFFAADKM